VTRWLRRPVIWIPISAILIALVAWRSKVWEAPAILGPVEPLPLVGAVLLNLLVVCLWAVRSHDLLDASGHRVGMRRLLPLVALANTLNNLTPGSSGEVVRAWMLRTSHGVPYSTGAAVIVIERLVAIGYMAGSAAIAWLAYRAGVPGPVQLALVLALAASPGLVYRTRFRPMAGLGRLPLGGMVGHERWARVSAGLATMDDRIAGLLGHPRHLAVFATTTALIFATYTSQLWLVGASVGVMLDPVPAWGALGLATVAGVISMLPFGLGATDLVLATLLVSLGVAPPVAAAVAFGYRLVATLPLGLLGTTSYGWLSSRLPSGAEGGLVGVAQADMAEDHATVSR
jgi:glycosyltransferase 2 family protein